MVANDPLVAHYTFGMIERLQHLWAGLRRFHETEVVVLEQVQLRNLRNLYRAAWVSWPIYALAASWLLLSDAGGWDAVPLWQRAVGLTHLLGVFLVPPLAWAARRALHHSPLSGWARALPVLTVAFSLAQGVAITVFYQWVTPKVTPMMVVATTSAALFYLRPFVSIGLFTTMMVAALWAMPLTQADPALLLASQASAIVIPLSACVLSLVMWFKNREAVLLTQSLADANEQLRAKQEELERLALHDGLTGLYNRTEFMRQAGRELKRAARAGQTTAVVLVDLDHFKHVNDQWGHPVGDVVLKHVSRLLQQGVRGSDLVARLGGEEFILMLCATDLEQAVQLADKLRATVASQPAQADDLIVPLTVSLGVVDVPPDLSVQWASIYAAVDAALYRAKAQGRNRVCGVRLGAG